MPVLKLFFVYADVFKKSLLLVLLSCLSWLCEYRSNFVHSVNIRVLFNIEKVFCFLCHFPLIILTHTSPLDNKLTYGGLSIAKIHPFRLLNLENFKLGNWGCVLTVF